MVPKIPDASLPLPFGLQSGPNYSASFKGCIERERDTEKRGGGSKFVNVQMLLALAAEKKRRAFDVKTFEAHKFFFYMYRMDSFLP